MIEASGLIKRYGPTVAVDGLSFAARPGAVTGFLGPNGSGKSTTMRMIMGLDPPDAGQAYIGGRRFHELRWPMREVGALLEARTFHPGRSARAHLRALAAAGGCPYGFRQANRAACGVAGRQYGGMPSLLWDDVRSFFDPDVMGALPDVSVAGASVEDWQAVFDLVRSGDWAWEYLQGELVGSLPAAAEVLARPADAEMVQLRVWPVPGVLVIFRPMCAEEIDFDVDLRELRGQYGVDVLCGFLSVVGRRLGKAVMMTAEGDYGHPALGFDPAVDAVVLMADPRIS